MVTELDTKKKNPGEELRYLISPDIPKKPQKSHCFFTAVNKKNKNKAKKEGVTYYKFWVDYKDPNFLMPFISTTGSILPRRKTGVSLKYQKKLAIAIKRARHLGLLPFVTDGLK